MVSLSQGWRIWISVLPESKYGSLLEAAEWMYKLNVFTRNVGRHGIKDQIYSLKNDLIRYLYQHGYSTEVTMQNQSFPCWGTWQNGCDEDCPKCGGSGIYRTEKLYAFRFIVDGTRFAWHQPATYVDYEVTLTNAQVGEFTAPRRDAAILNMEDAWRGSCIVWWSLFFHGVRSDLLLWGSTGEYLKRKAGLKLIADWIHAAYSSIKKIFLDETNEYIDRNDIPF